MPFHSKLCSSFPCHQNHVGKEQQHCPLLPVSPGGGGGREGGRGEKEGERGEKEGERGEKEGGEGGRGKGEGG